MARSRFGRGAIDPTDGSVNVMPAGFEVLYVTSASDDPLFIPGNQSQGDNSDSGSKAQRLADCRSLVSHRDDSNIATTRLGKAVQPGTLADW
jgi:hypothetical protein